MEKLWESYGNSRNIILLHKVFHSSMKKCYEKPRPFFFCYEKPLQGSFPPWFLGHDNMYGQFFDDNSSFPASGGGPDLPEWMMIGNGSVLSSSQVRPSSRMLNRA